MTRCLNLTRAGEYAVSALSRLALEARSSSGKPVSMRFLAKAQKIPADFLSKILAQCSKAGLVRSKRGSGGGLLLRRPAGEISLLAIIEACEGSYERESCVFFSSRVCRGPACEVYCPLRQGEQGVRDGLDRVTLAEMADSLGRHPDLDLEPRLEA